MVHVMTDTAIVSFTVLGVEAVRGVARLIGLANVRMEVAGIEFTLQGVQVLRMPDGKLNIRAPMFRHPRDGKFCRLSYCLLNCRTQLGRRFWPWLVL